MPLSYRSSLESITEQHLQGFFVAWGNPPTPEAHLRILQGSYAVELALDGERVVGFITAISDGVLSAYIPLLEVLPEYQKQGIGAELVRRMLARLQHLYMIDLMCDADLQAFYAQQGGRAYTGMIWRNYARQNGA